MDNKRLPTWRELADMLAERLSHQDYCANGHREDQIEAAAKTCPFCHDSAVYRLWQAKTAAVAKRERRGA